MSQHKRNVAGMQNAQRQKIESSILRVNTVIEDMILNNQSITFNSIAEQAKVSKAWLYGQSTLCEKIKELRLNNANHERPVRQSTIISLNSIINSLKTRINKLESENTELRKQLEVLYGELHMRK